MKQMSFDRLREKGRRAAWRAVVAVAGDLALRTLVAPRFAGAGLIVMLHRITSPDRVSLYPGFEVPVDWLERAIIIALQRGWTPVSLDDIPRWLEEPHPGRRFVCFTADDGYLDNYVIGLPVFRRHGIPFAVYVSCGLLQRDSFYWWGALEALILKVEHLPVELPDSTGGPCDLPSRSLEEKRAAYDYCDAWAHLWPTRVPEVFGDLFRRHGVDPKICLDRDIIRLPQLRTFAEDPLVTVGSHAVSHRPLSMLTDAELLDELAGSRRFLEVEIGRPVNHLAYPFGQAKMCGVREFSAARESGYLTGVTTRAGSVFPAHLNSMFSLPRRTARPTRHGMRDALYGFPSLLMRQSPIQTI
jgi:peptidoglycan/xylan/chitin deacetylase (PgdA/CDA1 family)